MTSLDFPKGKNNYQRITSNLTPELFKTGLISLLILPLLKLQSLPLEWEQILSSISYIECALIGLLIGVVSSILTSKFFHFLILYLLLYLKKLIPFNLVHFLNKATTHTSLLERDGGQWRFRHQLIQDALSEQWEEENKAPST